MFRECVKILGLFKYMGVSGGMLLKMGVTRIQKVTTDQLNYERDLCRREISVFERDY